MIKFFLCRFLLFFFLLSFVCFVFVFHHLCNFQCAWARLSFAIIEYTQQSNILLYLTKKKNRKNNWIPFYVSLALAKIHLPCFFSSLAFYALELMYWCKFARICEFACAIRLSFCLAFFFSFIFSIETPESDNADENFS